MIDPDDEQIIKDAKDGGAVLVTWDRVLLLAAGGMTPYEALGLAKDFGQGTKEAQAEVSRLRTLSPHELSALMDAGNKTYQLFRQQIELNEWDASLIRSLRVTKDYSWRAIARFCSRMMNGQWGGNQLAGMVICEKAAKSLGEDFLKPPWN
ncbi:MAG: hypothetical protein KKD44_27400 [Proteobacteria bacterium]|nr:hypothetical protein [Pseudomonadota bacterium]